MRASSRLARLHNFTFYILHSTLLCSLSASALPLTWRADWPDCKPVEKYVHRGTDVELEPTWYINGVPAATSNWTFQVFVQTNNQASGEWLGPIPGKTFSHTNDVGAAMYQVMLRAETPGGEVNYTAFARLRMLDSPGFSPGAIPLPVATIDFDQVTVLNPPWIDPDYSPANTQLVATIEATAPAPGNYAAVSNAAMTAVETSTNYTDGAVSSLRINLESGTVTVGNAQYALTATIADSAAYLEDTFYNTDLRCMGMDDGGRLRWTANYGENSVAYLDDIEDATNAVIAAAEDYVDAATTNFYTKAETDDAIDALAAYYITTSNGLPFASYAALTNTAVYYSGGEPRIPTRNDYAVVLADETHNTNEWRYIYTTAVVGGATNGQWEAQYPIDTNDYEALANKPSVGGVELSGDKTAAELGLATPESAATTATNAADFAVASADTSYRRYAAITNVNQSVQFVTLPSSATELAIELPATGETKDWIVYVLAEVETPLVLPAATWYMADTANTNAVPAGMTAFYFSQIATGIYYLGRQELAPVTIQGE